MERTDVSCCHEHLRTMVSTDRGVMINNPRSQTGYHHDHARGWQQYHKETSLTTISFRQQLMSAVVALICLRHRSKFVTPSQASACSSGSCKLGPEVNAQLFNYFIKFKPDLGMHRRVMKTLCNCYVHI